MEEHIPLRRAGTADELTLDPLQAQEVDAEGRVAAGKREFDEKGFAIGGIPDHALPMDQSVRYGGNGDDLLVGILPDQLQHQPGGDALAPPRCQYRGEAVHRLGWLGELQLELGWCARVSIADANTGRVTLLPPDGWREPRTWAREGK